MTQSEAIRQALNQALQAVQAGQLDLAEAIARKVLSAYPKKADAMFALGMILTSKEDFGGALHSFEQAAVLQPNDPQLHLQSGRCLVRLSRPIEALAAFQKAGQLSESAEIQMEIAELQSAIGKTTEAVESFSRVLNLDPNSFIANVLLARSLTELGQLDDAEPYWARAETLETLAGQTRLAKALAMALSGQFDRAEIAAMEAIQQDPRRGKPYHVIMSSRRATVADRTLIDRMEELRQHANIGFSDDIDLLYALGKAYHDLGEYEVAMNRFDAANLRLKSRSVLFDREAFKRNVDAQIQSYTRSKLSPEGGEEPELPLFVMGMIRSGTTLVDQILGCHPQVGSAGEQGFWLHHTQATPQPKNQYLELLSTIAPGVPRVIDKNPANVLVAGLLHEQFPSSRMICLRRHAVDTAISIWMTQMQTGAPFVYDKGDIVFAYREFLRLAEHWHDAMPKARYREVRYESLIESSESEIKELVAFCGLPWNDACLRPENNARAIKTPSFWQVRQPVYSTSIDRWKKYETWLGPFSELVGL